MINEMINQLTFGKNLKLKDFLSSGLLKKIDHFIFLSPIWEQSMNNSTECRIYAVVLHI